MMEVYEETSSFNTACKNFRKRHKIKNKKVNKKKKLSRILQRKKVLRNKVNDFK